LESYIFEGRDKRGYSDPAGAEKEAPNGWYDPKDGSIHIDLNAGNLGEGTVLYTLSHELTHFIEQWSKPKYKALAEFLIQEYEKGQSMDKLVLAKQKKLSEIRGEEVGYDEAYSEVVADSMEAVLADGNVLDKLVKLKKQDQTLFDKIKSFFDGLVTKVRNAYKNFKPDSAEGKRIMEMSVESIERLQ